MPSASPSARVLVFGRSGCHLCDEAEVVVDAVCAEAGVTWAKVAIDRDPDLLTAYGELIPVVRVDGRDIAQWRITADELRAALSH